MKRIFCFLLALLTVMTAVPVFVLPSIATDAASLAEDVVYVRFRMGNARSTSANKSENFESGTLVAERKCAPGFISFTLPTEEECYTMGVNPKNIIGWYAIGLDGTFVDARAYNGTYQTADLTFYPYLKSSGMGFNAPANIPIVKSGAITGLRSGWTVGEYTAKGFVPYKTIDANSGIVYNASPWSNGGAYYASGGGGSALVLSPSASRVLAISWTAIADGKVDLNFDSFIFNTGLAIPANATAYLAVAVDGKIVWPTAIAGNDVALTGFEAAGYYKIALGNEAAVSSGQTVDIKDGKYTGLDIKAGQSVRFIIGYGAGQTVELRPTVTYTEIGELSSAIVTKIPTYQSAAMDKENKPNAGLSSDTDPEITYPGAWQMITYPKLADITTADADLVEYYTKSTERTEFLTSLKDYGGAGSSPSLFVWDVAKNGTGNWGNYYDIAIKGSGSPIGFRYTVEHAGYITPAFDSLLWQKVAAGAANPERTYVAIFADGIMIWPEAGTVTELDTWWQPFVDADYASGTDVAAAANATIPEFYVQAGAKLDFIMYREGTGSIWNGCGNRMYPSVSYQSAAFVTNFTASGTLGEWLSLNFYANAGTASFAESVDSAYLLADSLTLDVTSASFGNHSFTAKNSLLTASLTDIAAKQMTDKVDYTLSATAKLPSGAEEKVVLQSGSFSFAEYLVSLYNNPNLDNPTRELALATLRYGAAAQTYFGYATDNLAGAGITDALSFTAEEVTDKYKQEGSGDYRFSYATLLLQDSLKLKLYIDATDAPRADWNEMYLQIDGSTAKLPLVQRDGDTNGSEMKLIITVPFSEYATDYTFRVFDKNGTQVSTTLTYSVATYAARMQTEAKLTDLLSAIRTVGVAADKYELATQPTDRGEVVSKFVILSDAHVGESLTNANGKLASALEQITEMGDVDAILFPGDMTNNGTDTEYAKFFEILTEAGYMTYDEESGVYRASGDTALSIVLGNHEFYRDGWDGGAANTEQDKQNVYTVFNDVFAPILDAQTGISTANNGLDHTYIINGTYIIGLSERSNNGQYGAEVEEYLMQQVKAAAEADPTKPIIVYSHIGHGAIQGSTKMSVSDDTAAFLANYPQIVWISGHTHYASQNPYMIQQGDFTNLQVPTSGSKWWWVYGSGYDHPASYAYEAAQGVIVSVTDTNVVIAQRYDFGTGETIGQEWVIDIPAILRSTDNFKYRVDDRKAQALAPEFGANDAITVSDIAEYSAKITFPIAHIKDTVSDDVVQYYYAVVVNAEGEVAYSKRMLSEYYRGSKQNPTVTFPISGLEDGTEYTVYVVAEGIFGQTSAALKTTFTTKLKEVATLDNLTALLSVDYSDGTPDDDANAHTYKAMKLSGTESVPTYANGRAVFDGNCAYRYTLTAGDVTATKKSITLETVIVINDGNKARPNINFDNRASVIANMEGGGFGLSYNYSAKTIYFSLSGLGVSVSKKISTETLLHIVATYDGTTLVLYVNGEVAASVACSSELVAANTKSLFVGSDTNGSSGMQCPAICEVAYFNLYAEGVTPGQAELMYENYVKEAEEPDEAA